VLGIGYRGHDRGRGVRVAHVVLHDKARPDLRLLVADSGIKIDVDDSSTNALAGH